MQPIDKTRAVLKLAIRSPRKVVGALKTFFKSGYEGLSKRVYDEAVKQEVIEPSLVDSRMPGSENGSIKFSVVMPVYNVDPKWLSKAVESVEGQIYANWELCIADDRSTNSQTTDFLSGLKGNPRIKVTRLEKNSGISEATNKACSLATGQYLVFMDNDDALSKDALLECYFAAGESLADVIYSDQDEITVDDQHKSPLHKPDWSPDLLLSQMYVGHLLCVRRSLFDEVGGLRGEYDGSQDYDLMLRLMEKTNRIRHIDKVLYSWRSVPSSTSANPEAKPYSQAAGLCAIQSHLDRAYPQSGCKAEETDSLFVYDVRYPLPADTLASIVIPTKDHYQDLKNTIDSITEKTEGVPYEIIILDNQSKEEDAVRYLEELSQRENVEVIDAPYAFNWSKLNNQGIAVAKGNVIVCLNNDVIVEEPDWLRRLAENALRDDIGIVGGLLLYPDGTIQHAGVVVGMRGWADHVYKGEKPVHCGSPFISPMLKRNVLAVTGACMAFSRDTYDEIGGFDEGFIVCGSDVEICLRAYRKGYRNLYDPKVVLTHYESKTRDAKCVPENDLDRSCLAYAEYRESGDPYFNKNLDMSKTTPTAMAKKEMVPCAFRLAPMIDEVRPLHFRKASDDAKRLNILLPSLKEENIFGGIATALKFFERFGSAMGCPMRIIVTDSDPKDRDFNGRFQDYRLVEPSDSAVSPRQIVQLSHDRDETLEVGNGDIFIFTIWWGAYRIQSEYSRWDASDLSPNPFIYLIQDFEPGFYPWSSRYVLAESTYRTDYPQIAIYNSKLLRDYFEGSGYRFEQEYFFEPRLNKRLKERLLEYDGHLVKRKRILVYGRPTTDRNAFEMIVEGLREWVGSSSVSNEWEILGAGESFEPIYLGKGSHLISLGKLSIDEYATILAGTFAGVSLMVSPHPSYPPLEMASYGIKVIANNFHNKNLSGFSDNIISLDVLIPHTIAQELEKIAQSYQSEVEFDLAENGYLDDTSQFDFIEELMKRY